MVNYANLADRKDLLDSITSFEKELSAKLGRDVAVVAYNPVQYAELNGDSDALTKITDLEQELSKKTGKTIGLVALSI